MAPPGHRLVPTLLRATLLVATLLCLPALPAAGRAASPLLASAQGSTEAAARWRIDRSDPARWVITVEPDAPRWIPVDEERGLYVVPGCPARDELLDYAVPSLRLPLTLPAEGEPRVRAIAEGQWPLPRGLEALAPLAEPLGDGEGWIDADATGFVQYRAPAWHGAERLLLLRVRPLWLDPQGRLSGAERLRIEIEFSASGGGGAGALPLEGARGAARAGRALRAAARPAEDFDTASSPWLRIEVDRRGVYRLTAQDLSGLGIEPSSVDPRELRLFCAAAGELPETTAFEALPAWMEPCALLVEDDGDGAWDEATEVLFVGNGPDGWRDDLDLPDIGEADRHYSHPSASRFTYWLCWGGDFSGEPLRMETLDADPGERALLEDGETRLHLERNLFYDSRQRTRGGAWPRFFQFSVSANSAEVGASITATLPDAVAEAGARLRVSLWGGSWGVNGLNNDHWARVRVDGQVFREDWWEGVARRDLAGTLPAAAASHLIAIYAPLRYDDEGEAIGDKIYFDWVEVDYRRRLQATGDSLAFFVAAEEAGAYGYRVRGLGATDDWLLLDAGDFRAPRRLVPRLTPAEGGWAAEFSVSPREAQTHLVLLRRGRTASPAKIDLRGWPAERLRERTAPVDYLIVTVPEMRAAAEALAAHRRSHFYGPAGDTAMAAEVAVVEMPDILDEFAWGQHDPVALRNFLDFARTAWNDPGPGQRLSHVLFLGDAHEDPRQYRGGLSRDLVPSYEFYDWVHQISQAWTPGFWGDDWFGFLDGPGDEGLDLTLGRLPAASATQAWTMVDKILAMESDAPLGDWKTDLIFAADDICQGNQSDNLNFAHMVQTELLTQLAVPPDARLTKLYLYEYGSECRYERKPEATQDLLEHIRAGTLVLNFIGHGSEIQLADERLLDNSSVTGLDNPGKPFLMITASCAVGRFTHGGTGLALQALRLPEGGAIAVISASSSASSAFNYTLNLYLLQQLFVDGSLQRGRALGPTFRAAKTLSGISNDLRYNLLGDPGARLSLPRRALALELADVPEVVADADTLIRGGAATLRGRVLDEQGLPLVGFEGTADIVVLDSDIHRSPVPSIPARDYELPGARIFSGSAAVAAGEFACPFFVPTALRTGARGAARIYAYARSASGDDDAAGARVELFIPETREPATSDTLGPEIELAWADPATQPRAGSRLAAALEDESGIYVAALAPARSVVLTIQDERERLLVAEDLAARVVFGADFRTAALEYSLPAGLPAGEPLTLALEASDNLGRRSRAETGFTLWEGDSVGVLLGLVYAMPNPVEEETRFFFEIGREADIEVSIYTVTGRKIVELDAERFTPARARETGLRWDGRDADGDRPANGVYFFRVVARDWAGRRAERIDRLALLR